MNVRVLGKGLELLNANGDRFEINLLLFSNSLTMYLLLVILIITF